MKRNRVELVSDFPNDAEVISSLQVSHSDILRPIQLYFMQMNSLIIVWKINFIDSPARVVCP